MARSCRHERLCWDRDGRDWPLRESSRFVEAAGIRWHVQRSGRGPAALLVHGTGATTHSWRGLAPLLADHFELVAPDLPGHGFSDVPAGRDLSLPAMAEGLATLLEQLECRPTLAIGHSAGAAVVCRMSLDGRLDARGLVSLNGALLPLRGWARRVFGPLARALVWNPVFPWLLARRASNPEVVENLLRDTGSQIDAEGVRLYGRLVGNPAHVAAALGMMASWNLDSLPRELADLPVPLALVVGERDRTIPPKDALYLRALAPNTTLISLPALGHLAHEEAPAVVADAIVEWAREQRICV